MGYTDFYQDKYMLILDGNTTRYIGYFNTDDNLELAHIMLDVYFKGTLGGSEQGRLKIYSDAELTTVVYTGEWFDFSDIGVDSNYLARIRADFNRENINKNINYYVGFETANYTKNGDTFYIGLCRDYPIYVNGSPINADQAPYFKAIYGYY